MAISTEKTIFPVCLTLEDKKQIVKFAKQQRETISSYFVKSALKRGGVL